MPEMNPFAAEAIRNIKSGRAAYQKSRDLQQRAVVGGIQAGLMGGAGLLGWAKNKADTDRAAKESRMSMGKDVHGAIAALNAKAADKEQFDGDVDYIRNNNKLQDLGQDRLSTPFDEKGPEFRDDVDVIRGRIDNAEAGVANPYGDVWNRRAFDEANDEASLLANDIGVANSLIKQSSEWEKNRRGLGGSLGTWGK